MPVLEVYLKEKLFWRYPFRQDVIRIGRDRQNEIILSDPAVSRVHATVRRLGDRYTLIDQSTNGTFLNEERVERAFLSDGDRVQIAEFALLFLADKAAEDAVGNAGTNHVTTVVRAYDEASHRLTFERFFLLLSRGDRTQKFPIAKTKVRIGFALENDITIQDPSVSPYHAVISYRVDRFHLKDLNSAEGTYVKGERVSETALTAGSVIRFGKVGAEFVSSTEDTTLKTSRESPFPGMVGSSPSMSKIYSLIARVAGSPVPVLLQGETGTGKELVARALHGLSGRAEGSFVVVNCGAIPKTLIESEFFGHRKGAFTGADADRIGDFERADGGTIFLDEIGELPLDLQPRLLRVIEDKSVTRVGSNEAHPTDFRLVTATNRKLEEEVRAGRFREDLYFRISVVPVTLPPLRERKEDIPLLVEHVLSLKGEESGTGRADIQITNQAQTKLMMHDWPGNVRELKNVIERALLMSGKDKIDAEDLTFTPIGRDEIEEVLVKGTLSLEEVEKRVILHTLKAHNWDKKTAAEVLGVAYSTLWAKLKKYNITT